MKTLDVTEIEPAKKHPTIFEWFDALKEGETFIISNDHDPKPLYYQFKAERGETFTWEYEEEGPAAWRVKISKHNMQKKKTIGDIVAADYRKAEIFRKYGIDFCYEGEHTLIEICGKKGIKTEELKESLVNLDNQPKKNTIDFKTCDLDFLTDYIVATHHRYVKDNLPILSDLTDKVANRHGKLHPELFEIKEALGIVANELYNHMPKEENTLFPYIKKLVKAKINKSSVPTPPFGTIKNPIRVMEAEHDTAEKGTQNISRLSNGYTAPEDACDSYRMLYNKLKDFDDDLKEHLHLENNILFPKSTWLEDEIYILKTWI